MGYVLSIFLNALQTWLYTKLWDSFFIRRFSGRKFWSYWLLWTAITTVIINVLPYDYDYINILRFLIEIALDYAMSLTLSQQMGSAIVCCNNRVFLLFFHCSADRKGIAVLFGHDASGVCV